MPMSKISNTPTKIEILDNIKHDVLDFWNAQSVMFLDYKKYKSQYILDKFKKQQYKNINGQDTKSIHNI